MYEVLWSACLFVYLSAHMSQKPYVRVSVARSCFDENTSRCVDDVMFSHMAPVGHIQRQRMFSSSSPGDDTILMSVDVMYG